MLEFFLKLPHLCLTFLHHISKIWEGVLQFLFLWIFSQCVLGWGIFSKMLPSFPPQFLRVFEGDPQKTLKANPHSHLEILALNLKNSALILNSNFEGF